MGIFNLLILYGIKNCDGVRNAKKWLQSSGIDFEYHDFRKNGIDLHRLQRWLNTLGWESIINRRSTSWKTLDSSVRDDLNNERAIHMILKNPTLIKRPVIESQNILLVGFKAAEYTKYFARLGKEKNNV